MGITPARSTVSRRGLVATAAAVVLAFLGGVLIVYAVMNQDRAPQPPLSVAQSPTPTSTVTATPADTPTTTATPADTPAPSVGVTPIAPVQEPVSQKPAPKVVGRVLPASLPVSLAIPAIGVQTPMLRLGQTAQGSLEVPAPGPDYDKAAWYKSSPTPGELGPAIINGHIDSADKGPSVFYRLGGLRPGDKVQVTREDNSVAVFAVTEVKRFRKKDFPTQFVYGNTDHAALRIITCGGPFNRDSGSYLDNIIVLASLVA